MKPLSGVDNDMKPGAVIPAFSLPYLMAIYGWDHVDYLKVDIETGEQQLFSTTSLATGWLSKVGCVSIELHEAQQPGCCTKPFHDAMQQFVFKKKTNGRELEVWCRSGFDAVTP